MYRYILIISFLFLTINVFSQEKFSITGKVQVEDGSPGGLIMIIHKDAVKLEERSIPKTGKFSLKLDFGYDYELAFTKEAFVTKRISISTFVPADILETNSRFPAFKFSISLFPAYEGLDLSIFDQPMGLIMYNKEVDDFDYDRDYDDQIKDAISKVTDKARELALQHRQELELRDDKFYALIKKGDKLFKNKKYIAAKDIYLQANKVFVKDPYPKKQIVRIDDILSKNDLLASKERELNLKYDGYIKSADLKFQNEEFTEAIDLYSNALEIKVNEKYPKSQISLIKKILKDRDDDKAHEAELLAKTNTINDKYNLLIQQADTFLSTKEYQASLVEYISAKNLKPNETYPPEQILKINLLIAKQEQDALAQANALANDKQKQRKYDKYILLADKLFKKEKYDQSILEYTSAISILKDEYPIGQIEIIKEIQAKRMALLNEKNSARDKQMALNNKYTKLILSADVLFKKEIYNNVLAIYAEAGTLKPNEKYPPEQISKINLLLAKQAQDKLDGESLLASKKLIDTKYDALINKANAMFISTQYHKSRELYVSANKIKPNDNYSKARIMEIDKILSAQKSSQANKAKNEAIYQAHIAKANDNFETKDYKISKFYYNKALSVKLNDKRSIDRIEEIDAILKLVKKEDSIVSRQKLKDDKSLEIEYNDCIKKGDKAFEGKKLDVASFYYRKAVNIKNADYPKSQMFKINELWKSGKYAKERREYQAWVNKGDEQIKSKNYAVARFNYKKALQIYGAEEYPKAQIKEIAQLLKKSKRDKLLKEYNKYISQGDDNFDKGQKTLARFYYSKALKLMPKEKIAKEKLNKIK